MVPGKRVDIVPVSPDGQVDKGLKFVLLDTVATADNLTSPRGVSVSKVAMSDKVFGSKENIDHYRSHRSTEELSGGQRALLGLSFVFAAALHKRSPLYLLDEVSYTAHAMTTFCYQKIFDTTAKKVSYGTPLHFCN